MIIFQTEIDYLADVVAEQCGELFENSTRDLFYSPHDAKERLSEDDVQFLRLAFEDEMFLAVQRAFDRYYERPELFAVLPAVRSKNQDSEV